jgi:hypothetical protein
MNNPNISESECEPIWDLLSVYADREATPEEARRVEQHIGYCADCSRDLAFIQKTAQSLSHVPEVLPPVTLRQAILAATVQNTPVSTSFGQRFQESWERLFARRPINCVSWGLAGAAAVLLLGFVVMNPWQKPTSTPVPPLASVPNIGLPAPERTAMAVPSESRAAPPVLSNSRTAEPTNAPPEPTMADKNAEETKSEDGKAGAGRSKGVMKRTADSMVKRFLSHQSPRTTHREAVTTRSVASAETHGLRLASNTPLSAGAHAVAPVAHNSGGGSRRVTQPQPMATPVPEAMEMRPEESRMMERPTVVLLEAAPPVRRDTDVVPTPVPTPSGSKSGRVRLVAAKPEIIPMMNLPTLSRQSQRESQEALQREARALLDSTNQTRGGTLEVLKTRF